MPLPRSPIIRKGQQKPWNSIPRINWQHPLAQKLVAYMYDMGGGAVIELVNGELATTVNNVGNAATPKATKFGGALVTPGTGAGVGTWFKMAGPSPLADNFSQTAPFSFATGYMPTGARASGQAPVSCFTNTSGNWDAMVCCIPDFGFNGVTVYAADTTQNTITTTEAAQNTFNTTCGVVPNASNFIGYHIDSAQGFKTNTVAMGALSTFVSLSPIHFNFDTGTTDINGSGYVGACYYSAYWKNRALSSAEFMSLHSDPWQFLIYPEDEIFASLINITAAVATPAFGWTPELPTLPWQKSRIKELSGPILSFRPSVQDIPWRNDGWEVQPPQPPHPRIEKAAPLIRGDDGVDIRRVWINDGWEIQSPQPPHPRPEKFGSIAPKDDGNQGIFQFWRNAGWEVPPPMVRQPYTKLYGSIMPKDDGTQAKFIDWKNAGWEIQSPQPPKPTQWRGAGFVLKDDGIADVQRNWQNAGWEVQPWQPPHPRPERFGTIAPREDGIAFPYINWFNAGWEVQAVQPPHTRWERAGAIMPWEPGNENTFIFQIVTVLSGYDPVLPDLRKVLRRWFLAQPVDGIDYPLLGWQNAGWEVQPYQPQHLRPERAGSVMRGDDGTEYQFINWANMGWEVQPPPPPHPRPERAGSLGTVFNIDAQYNPFVSSPAYEVQSWQPPRPWWERRSGSFAGVTVPPEPFVPPALTAWGYEPIFTYKFLRNRGLMAEMVRQGYDLTPFGFTDFGWPIQPWQPPHPRPEHGAALIFPFIELTDIIPPPPRTQIPMRTLVGMGL